MTFTLRSPWDRFELGIVGKTSVKRHFHDQKQIIHESRVTCIQVLVNHVSFELNITRHIYITRHAYTLWHPLTTAMEKQFLDQHISIAEKQ